MAKSRQILETMSKIFFCALLVMTLPTLADPTWDQGVSIPENGRANPLQIPPELHGEMVRAGKLHAQIYPVSVTGLLPPYRPAHDILDATSNNPVRNALIVLFKKVLQIKSMNDLMAWIGLHPYPKTTDTGVYSVPYPNNNRPDYLMGYGILDHNGTPGFTISCAGCHSSVLFGKTVLGLTNRFPKANHFFKQAQKAAASLNPTIFKKMTNATPGEMELIYNLKNNVKAIGVIDPIVLGLDTSLAQVSLSLAKRNPDAWATRSHDFEKHPRPDLLQSQRADSKPAVWWNVKYKNRWLSDGSVISGNPIFTNILWNEIGRGADLVELDKWLSQNQKVIDEIATAVFSIEPPRITDFFPAEKIDLARAQQGEKLFNQSCAKCHGTYEKAWSRPITETANLTTQELLQTTKVKYKTVTKVVNVGTDPSRYLGMKSLEKLNDLEISKKNGTRIEAQNGYVPPPLVGIWARWPYFHNNSVASLCDVLNMSSNRAPSYYAGEAINSTTDFDFDCNGYPIGAATPQHWKTPEYFYDSKKVGMSNRGHDIDILEKDGVEKFSNEDKKNLIQFLQTL